MGKVDRSPQAPAVDTIEYLPPSKALVEMLDVIGQAKATVQLTTRGTPRIRAPKGTFDRKAYQREAARKRRAAQKAKP